MKPFLPSFQLPPTISYSDVGRMLKQRYKNFFLLILAHKLLQLQLFLALTSKPATLILHSNFSATCGQIRVCEEALAQAGSQLPAQRFIKIY